MNAPNAPINGEKKINKEDLNKLIKQDNFTEDYTSNLSSNYYIYISPKGMGLKPEWNYFLYNELGHFKVIKQQNAFNDNRTVIKTCLNYITIIQLFIIIGISFSTR